MTQERITVPAQASPEHHKVAMFETWIKTDGEAQARIRNLQLVSADTPPKKAVHHEKLCTSPPRQNNRSCDL
jgi:hypothetical protein